MRPARTRTACTLAAAEQNPESPEPKSREGPDCPECRTQSVEPRRSGNNVGQSSWSATAEADLLRASSASIRFPKEVPVRNRSPAPLLAPRFITCDQIGLILFLRTAQPNGSFLRRWVGLYLTKKRSRTLRAPQRAQADSKQPRGCKCRKANGTSSAAEL